MCWDMKELRPPGCSPQDADFNQMIAWSCFRVWRKICLQFDRNKKDKLDRKNRVWVAQRIVKNFRCKFYMTYCIYPPFFRIGVRINCQWCARDSSRILPAIFQPALHHRFRWHLSSLIVGAGAVFRPFKSLRTTCSYLNAPRLNT